MDHRRTDAVDWGRIAGRLLFLVPPVIGVGFVGVLRETDPGVPLLDRGLVLFGTFGYTLLTVALAVVLALDARSVRARGGEWRPRPIPWALGALLWAPAAGVAYLFRRHRHLGTPAGDGRWWLVVAVSLATTLFGVVGAVVAIALSVPALLGVAVGLAGAGAFGAFPIAVHQDAAYVCDRAGAWRPNPALYLGLAFASLTVPPLQPIVAGYYLARRFRHLGTAPLGSERTAQRVLVEEELE